MDDSIGPDLREQERRRARQLERESHEDLAEKLQTDYAEAGWDVHVSRPWSEMTTIVSFEAQKGDRHALIELYENEQFWTVNISTLDGTDTASTGDLNEYFLTWREAVQYARGIVIPS